MKPFLILPVAISLSGCVGSASSQSQADPAYDECEYLSGRFEVSDGVAYCHLPDGRVLDELDLIIGI